MNTTKPRNSTIDFIKGAAIVLMVMGHSGCGSFLTRFIYLFHMPVFFMAFGWFAGKEVKSIPALGEIILKRILRLYLPFVLWISIFTILNNFFVRIHVYTNDPQFLQIAQGNYVHLTGYTSVVDTAKNLFWTLFMLGGCEMAGAFWFLRALFVASIAYAISQYLKYTISRKYSWAILEYWQTIVAITILVFSKYGYGPVCHHLPQLKFIIDMCGGFPSLTAFALIHLGVLLRQYYAKKKNILPPSRPLQNILWFVTMSILLTFLMRFGRFEIGKNIFPRITILLVSSLSGWLLLSSLSGIFEQHCKPIHNAITYIGIHTMPILIFHFLSFKIVSALGVFYFHDPLCKIASFPFAYSGLGWFIAYTIVGISVPLALDFVYRKCKNLFSKFIRDTFLS